MRVSASSEAWRIEVEGEVTSALYEPAIAGSTSAVFVCAHGAGGHMNDGGMLRVSEILRASGFDIVRFNFVYRETGSKRPDRMPILEACTRAVVAHVRKALEPSVLVIGGRSMGGRAASMLAAGEFDCDGLLLLAYPLHPAGKPEKLRDAHLARIRVPVLCFNGTRDALCTRELMDRVLASVQAPWEMVWLEGADHSFHVLRSSGTTDDQVLEQIGKTCADWLARLQSRKNRSA